MLTKKFAFFLQFGHCMKFCCSVFLMKNGNYVRREKKTHTQTCMRTSETLFVALENWLYRCKAFFNLYTVPPPPSSCQLERSTITESKPTKARKKSKLFTKKSHWLAVWLTRVELRAWIVDEDGWMNVFRTFYVMVYGLYEDKGDGGEVSGRRGWGVAVKWNDIMCLKLLNEMIVSETQTTADVVRKYVCMYFRVQMLCLYHMYVCIRQSVINSVYVQCWNIILKIIWIHFS